MARGPSTGASLCRRDWPREPVDFIVPKRNHAERRCNGARRSTRTTTPGEWQLAGADDSGRDRFGHTPHRFA
jgi:hypothetical protein